MRLPTTLDEVLARMREIDAGLPAHDGVAVFNRIYLTVTERVSEILAQQPTAGTVVDLMAALRASVEAAKAKKEDGTSAAKSTAKGDTRQDKGEKPAKKTARKAPAKAARKSTTKTPAKAATRKKSA